jgi:hypothetical protein
MRLSDRTQIIVEQKFFKAFQLKFKAKSKASVKKYVPQKKQRRISLYFYVF